MAAPVAFLGSRCLPPAAGVAVAAAARRARLAGFPVFVGSGPGGFPSSVRAGGRPAVVVWSPEFPGPRGLAARAGAMVRASGRVVAFPGCPCPPGVVPARSWRSGSPPSGCWSELALAVGLGLPAVVIGVVVVEADLPAWPGGSWRGFRRHLGASSVRCWVWSPAQPSLL